jgi:DNA-binding response OmpR family regulator
MSGDIGEYPSPARGNGQHVLVVDDDPGTIDLLTTTLELAGYRVGTAGSGVEALARIAADRVDLVILDAELPDLEDVGRGYRVPVSERPPVLFLVPCEYLSKLLPGLGASTDDYVTRPFRIAEVLARTQMLLRGRNPGRRSSVPYYGDLTLDDVTCQAWRGARPLDLTPAEYRLLRFLLVNSEQVLSKEQIGRHVWGEVRADNAIEKLLSRLRHKVNQEDPVLIHTRRGFGYWLGRSARL